MGIFKQTKVFCNLLGVFYLSTANLVGLGPQQHVDSAMTLNFDNFRAPL